MELNDFSLLKEKFLNLFHISFKIILIYVLFAQITLYPHNGAEEGLRSPDLILTKDALYHLSYDGI